jgi:hypothetical protein
MMTRVPPVIAQPSEDLADLLKDEALDAIFADEDEVLVPSSPGFTPQKDSGKGSLLNKFQETASSNSMAAIHTFRKNSDVTGFIDRGALMSTPPGIQPMKRCTLNWEDEDGDDDYNDADSNIDDGVFVLTQRQATEAGIDQIFTQRGTIAGAINQRMSDDETQTTYQNMEALLQTLSISNRETDNFTQFTPMQMSQTQRPRRESFWDSQIVKSRNSSNASSDEPEDRGTPSSASPDLWLSSPSPKKDPNLSQDSRPSFENYVGLSSWDPGRSQQKTTSPQSPSKLLVDEEWDDDRMTQMFESMNMSKDDDGGLYTFDDDDELYVTQW